jgi:hypothetical protein
LTLMPGCGSPRSMLCRLWPSGTRCQPSGKRLRVNGYTLNLLKSRADLPKVKSFQDWLFEELGAN